MDEPAFERVAVIGLGLIGGSIALALQARGLARTVVACDPNLTQIAAAAERGLIEQGYSRATDAVVGADAVLLAAPVRAILTLLPQIGPRLEPGCFVMDFGSTKQEITGAMARLPDHVGAVGGHPMAGKEISGLDAAESDLFEGATIALCPTTRSHEAARARADWLVSGLGARPLWCDAAEHDAAVARVSHLPYLAAAAVATAGRPDGLARELAAAGYRDSTRLAVSDPRMMLDILLTNRDAVRPAVHALRCVLDDLERHLEQQDEAALEAWMRRARALR